MHYSVMYRGLLSSCNYACGYCPFAMRKESADRLREDRRSLASFADWIAGLPQHAWKILFTPWGEALVRPAYRRAVERLSHLRHVETVAVQTNLSCGLEWIDRCDPRKLVLWATYHPTEVQRAAFVRKVLALRERGVELSAGMVGAVAHLEEAETLRRELPEDVYLWINAQQPRPRPYTPQEEDRFRRVDPHFDLSLKRQPSLGRSCPSGETSFTVDGRGDLRRCHFVDEVIGSIHSPDWEAALRPRLCPRRFCDCFLGKAQLQADPLRAVFGGRGLVRLPVAPPAS